MDYFEEGTTHYYLPSIIGPHTVCHILEGVTAGLTFTVKLTRQMEGVNHHSARLLEHRTVFPVTASSPIDILRTYDPDDDPLQAWESALTESEKLAGLWGLLPTLWTAAEYSADFIKKHPEIVSAVKRLSNIALRHIREKLHLGGDVGQLLGSGRPGYFCLTAKGYRRFTFTEAADIARSSRTSFGPTPCQPPALEPASFIPRSSTPKESKRKAGPGGGDKPSA
jgi:hypothetical protein